MSSFVLSLQYQALCGLGNFIISLDYAYNCCEVAGTNIDTVVLLLALAPRTIDLVIICDRLQENLM